MDNNEIKEALDELRFRKDILPEDSYVSVLIRLAEAYLKAGEELPERIEKPKEEADFPYAHGVFYGTCVGYNQAIEDCRLAFTKKLEGLEKTSDNSQTSPDNIWKRRCEAFEDIALAKQEQIEKLASTKGEK